MNHIYIEQQNLPELVDAQFLDDMKDIVDTELDNNSDLKGNLQTVHVYNDTFNFFVNNFPRLSIIATGGQYIRFEDPVIFNTLLTNNIGDGVGITLNDASIVTSLPSFKSNTDITKFNELIYFNRMTSIRNEGFRDCTNLTEIDLTNILSIGGHAFRNTGLINVYMPNCSSFIDFTFYECKQLTYADISGWAGQSGGSEMFEWCSNLKKVKMMPGVTKLSYNMFFGCTNLEEIENLNFSELTSVSEGAFGGCNSLFGEDKPFINQNITRICKLFYENTSITEVRLPNCTEVVKSNMYGGGFQRCTNLHTVVLSKNLTMYPENTFHTCSSLESVDLTNVVSLGSSCFESSGIKTVDAPNLVSISDYCFNNCKSLTSVNAPSLENVSTRAFMGCSNLSETNLPNITIIPQQCFSGCTSLTTTGIDYTNVTSIGQDAFYQCNNLTDRLVFTSLTDLSNIRCFLECKSITYVDISNVTTLNSYEYGGTFQNCENLETVILSPNLTHLHRAMFAGCKKLKNIDISHITSLKGDSTGVSIFYNCIALESITFNENLTEIPSSAFENCYSLSELTIPASVTYIGSDAFKSCKIMKKATVLATTPPTLGNKNAFDYADIAYPIYVPAESVEAYKSADKWSYLSSRIFAIQDS